MKIAVIGCGPLGLECALTLHKLGAGVTVFSTSSSKVIESQQMFKTNEITSPEGRGIVSELPSEMSLAYYKKLYLEPIKNYLIENLTFKNNEVSQVQKRFFKKHEDNLSVSRFSDLFRIVYEVKPDASKTTPDLKEKMSQELINSLEGKMEFFEDFDVVIDATGPQIPKPMGHDFHLVGEKKLQNVEGIYYGYNVLTHLQKSEKKYSEVALLGSTELSAMTLFEMKDWFLKNESHRVFLISHEARPLEKIKNLMEKHKPFMEFMEKLDQTLEARIVKFEKDLAKWNELETYEQAKIPHPQDPIPQIVIFSGHQVTAVDRLIDKNRFFLTSEVVPFREIGEQKENGAIPLKTIGVDEIYVTNGFDYKNLDYSNLKIGLDTTIQPEVGFYFLRSSTLKEAFLKISEIQEDLLKRFSRK